MAVKGFQQALLDDIKTQGELKQQQADWLMKEHAKNQAALEKLYDDEITRQRVLLEEKLEKRRALVDGNNLAEEHDRETEDMMIGQQLVILKKDKG